MFKGRFPDAGAYLFKPMSTWEYMCPSCFMGTVARALFLITYRKTLQALSSNYGTIVSVPKRRVCLQINEPKRTEMYLLTGAPIEDSDQPAHPRSLISLRCPHDDTLHPW